MSGSYKTCTVSGCTNMHSARGYCAGHYSRWRKNPETATLTPLKPRRTEEIGCVISGCNRRHYCFGMCGTHYSACNIYGLSPIQIQVLYDRGCEICNTLTNLAIDHDHSCCPIGNSKKCGYCVRGLLCRSCNMAIGALGDDPKKLFRAFEYLRLSKHGAW